MKTLLRAAALLLAAAFLLPFSGCSEIKKALREAIITEAPTEAPTPEPTEEPTSEPADPNAFSFDRTTRLYEDGYVRFTAPDGMVIIRDLTDDYGHIYVDGSIVSIMFLQPGDKSLSLYYEASDVRKLPRQAIAAYLTEDELTDMLVFALEESYGVAFEIRPVRYEAIRGKHFDGMIYEYSTEFEGEELNQCLWSVVNDHGVCLSLSFTNVDRQAIDLLLGAIEVK